MSEELHYLEHVTLPRRWPSLLGALEGLLGALGRLPLAPEGAISDHDYLLGISGLAFHTSLDLVISSEGPAAYPFHQLYPLWERLRIWFRYTGTAADDPKLPTMRAQAREQIANSLARGWPAIAYDLGGLAEYSLVVGLSGDTLQALRPAGSPEPVVVPLAEMPTPAHPWSKLEVITAVGVEQGFDRSGAEEAALRFAVDHGWAPPSRDGWLYFGLKAYNAWRAAMAMPHRTADAAQGMAYCAEYYARVRRGAARFCWYLAGARGWSEVARAAEAYEEEARHLDAVRERLPFVGPDVPEEEAPAQAQKGRAQARSRAQEALARSQATLQDAGARKELEGILYRAQRAHEQALGALEDALRRLRY